LVWQPRGEGKTLFSRKDAKIAKKTFFGPFGATQSGCPGAFPLAPFASWREGGCLVWQPRGEGKTLFSRKDAKIAKKTFFGPFGATQSGCPGAFPFAPFASWREGGCMVWQPPG